MFSKRVVPAEPLSEAAAAAASSTPTPTPLKAPKTKSKFNKMQQQQQHQQQSSARKNKTQPKKLLSSSTRASAAIDKSEKEKGTSVVANAEGSEVKKSNGINLNHFFTAAAAAASPSPAKKKKSAAAMSAVTTKITTSINTVGGKSMNVKQPISDVVVIDDVDDDAADVTLKTKTETYSTESVNDNKDDDSNDDDNDDEDDGGDNDDDNAAAAIVIASNNDDTKARRSPRSSCSKKPPALFTPQATTKKTPKKKNTSRKKRGASELKSGEGGEGGGATTMTTKAGPQFSEMCASSLTKLRSMLTGGWDKGIDSTARDIVNEYPDVKRAAVVRCLGEIAIKEKRGEDTKAKFYLKETNLENNGGEHGNNIPALNQSSKSHKKKQKHSQIVEEEVGQNTNSSGSSSSSSSVGVSVCASSAFGTPIKSNAATAGIDSSTAAAPAAATTASGGANSRKAQGRKGRAKAKANSTCSSSSLAPGKTILDHIHATSSATKTPASTTKDACAPSNNSALSSLAGMSTPLKTSSTTEISSLSSAKKKLAGTPRSAVKTAERKQKPSLDLSYKTDAKYLEAVKLLETLITKQQHLFLENDNYNNSTTKPNTIDRDHTNNLNGLDVDVTSDCVNGITIATTGDISTTATTASTENDIDSVSSSPANVNVNVKGDVDIGNDDLGLHSDTTALVSEWLAQRSDMSTSTTPQSVSALMSDPSTVKLIAHLVQGSSSNLGKLVRAVGKVLFHGDQDGDAIEKYTHQLEEAIKLRAGRKPYALKPHKDAVLWDDEDAKACWRWEVVRDEHFAQPLPKELSALRKQRRALSQYIGAVARLVSAWENSRDSTQQSARVAAEEVKVLKYKQLEIALREKQNKEKEDREIAVKLKSEQALVKAAKAQAKAQAATEKASAEEAAALKKKNAGLMSFFGKQSATITPIKNDSPHTKRRGCFSKSENIALLSSGSVISEAAGSAGDVVVIDVDGDAHMVKDVTSRPSTAIAEAAQQARDRMCNRMDRALRLTTTATSLTTENPSPSSSSEKEGEGGEEQIDVSDTNALFSAFRKTVVAARRKLDQLPHRVRNKQPVAKTNAHVVDVDDNERVVSWAGNIESNSMDGATEQRRREDIVHAMDSRVKLLKFHDNRRPAYFGTFRSLSGVVNARRILKHDASLEYDVDSDDEWEEPEENAESLSDADDDEDEEGGELDYEDGWLMQDDEIMVSDDDNSEDDADGDDQEGSDDESCEDGGVKRKRRRDGIHAKRGDVVKKTAMANANMSMGSVHFTPPSAVGVCTDGRQIEMAAEEDAKRGAMATSASVADQKAKAAEAKKASREVLVVAISVNTGPDFARLHKLKCIDMASSAIRVSPPTIGLKQEQNASRVGVGAAIVNPSCGTRPSTIMLPRRLIGGMMSSAQIAHKITEESRRPPTRVRSGGGASASASNASAKKPVRVAITKTLVSENATELAGPSAAIVAVGPAAAGSSTGLGSVAWGGLVHPPGCGDVGVNTAVPSTVDMPAVPTTATVVVTLSVPDYPINDRPTLESIEATIRKAGGRTAEWVADEVYEYFDTVSKSKINVAIKVMGKRELGQNGAKASWTVLVTAQEYLDMSLEQYATTLTARNDDKVNKRKRRKEAKEAKENAVVAATGTGTATDVGGDASVSSSGNVAGLISTIASDGVVGDHATQQQNNKRLKSWAIGSTSGGTPATSVAAVAAAVVPPGEENINTKNTTGSIGSKKRTIDVCKDATIDQDSEANLKDGQKNKKARDTAEERTGAVVVRAMVDAAAKPLLSFFQTSAKQ